MILKYSVHPNRDNEHAVLAGPRDQLGLSDLRLWRDYYIEVAQPPAAEVLDQLRPALGDALTEEVLSGQPLRAPAEVQVTYRRGIIDNENDSLVALARLLGIDATAARVATTYASDDPRLPELVEAAFVNPNIEELHLTEPHYEHLGPLGHADPPALYDLAGMTDAELARTGTEGGRNLSLEQMKQIRHIQTELGLGAVTDVLIEALDARWSDHCLHTTWTALGDLLGKLIAASRRADNPNVVSMFKDNAGVWDFYDGWALAIKGETHSGPSAVSAYFGQLTKLGGVLRDILGTGLGADPIGSFEYTATAPPELPAPIPGRPAPRQIAHETIRAIKEYGNTFGVPMMWSKMTLHPAYRAKPFALGGSIGLIPTSVAQPGDPRPGDLLMLIGGLTGNDGIHGASASSAGSEMDEASVQIGSPLEQVKFRQAIVDLRDAGCLRAVTDVGGAGLNSAVGEMGDPGGVWLNAALVPLKTAGLPTWRILLSESQERMLLAVIPDALSQARTILDRHGVRKAVIGRFMADGCYTVVHAPALDEQAVVAAELDALPREHETGFSVHYDLIDYVPPPLETAPPPARGGGGDWPTIELDDLPGLATQIMSEPEVASQRWASSQYDSTVQGHSLYGPTAGDHHVPTSVWAGSPVPTSSGLATFAVAFNPWLFDADPALATRQMFLSVLGSQVLAGVAVRDICLCDNFYTPHMEPDGFSWLVAMVDELVALVDRFGTPLISGKDSSAGSVVTPDGVVSVPPAVFLSSLGKLPDASRLRRNEWTAAGNLLVRIGLDTPSPTGTAGARVLGIEPGSIDAVSAADFGRYLAALEGVGEGTVVSGRPIDAGGTLAALLLGSLASGLGADVTDLGDPRGSLAEHRTGALVEVPESAFERLPSELHPQVVGRVTEGPPSVRVGELELLTRDTFLAWRDSWAERMR